MPDRTDPQRPLRVVSVSTGSSKRDAERRIVLLGREVILRRVGTDGDLRRAAATYRELAPTTDAFGMGGTDLRLALPGRTYLFRESARLARHAGSVPVVCGAGLKATLEPRAVATLDRRVHWRDKRVLVPSAVDRYGMAQALHDHGAHLKIGDFAFLLKVPYAPRDLQMLVRLTRIVAPVVTRLPMAWLYPTGAKQEGSARRDLRSAWIEQADAVAGDFHLIQRFAPPDLTGKVILTNTTTEQDLSDMLGRGAALVATTTPRIEGRSLATNLLEAAFVAIAGRHPLPLADLDAMVAEAGLEPNVHEA